jgi:hypothetical protein
MYVAQPLTAMAATETLRVRVDKDLARQVHAWAKEHDTDVSGALRAAIRSLVHEDAVRRAIRKEFDEYERAGLFERPRGRWKAGGLR